MEYERIEYLRKNDGFRVIEGTDEKKMVTRGEKKGVLFCGIDPEDNNSVIMGFSLCSSLDRFDYINGKLEKGFGMKTAKERAEKWRFHDDYFVQNTFTEVMIDNGDDLLMLINPNSQQIVEVPPSVMPRLKIFIERCKRYYKDKEFPAWTKKIEMGTPFPNDMLETELVTDCFDVF